MWGWNITATGWEPPVQQPGSHAASTLLIYSCQRCQFCHLASRPKWRPGFVERCFSTGVLLLLRQCWELIFPFKDFIKVRVKTWRVLGAVCTALLVDSVDPVKMQVALLHVQCYFFAQFPLVTCLSGNHKSRKVQEASCIRCSAVTDVL